MGTDDRDPFDAYHDSLSGPDVATTSRLEERLDQYLEHGRARNKSRLIRRIAVVAVGATAIGAAVVLWPAATDDTPAMIVADGAPQGIELVSGGHITVPDGGRVRVLQNDANGALIDLDAGTARVETPADNVARVRVRVATFEIEAFAPAQLRVAKTPAEPEVTVLAGKAVLTGPNLPAAGVEIRPAGE